MFSRVLISIVVAIFVALAATLVGALLVRTGAELAVIIGSFLADYSTLLGVLAGLWYFFSRRLA